MRYVIVDLEATCWNDGTDRSRMEIIEIGAVLLDSSSGPAKEEFAEFVRPVVEPKLSAFCTELTTIQQKDIDGADDFPTVFPRFMEWIGAEPFTLCSWGAYDLNQFKMDCMRHLIPFPESLTRHISLKAEFARIHSVKPCGMASALRILKMPLAGQHHRAIDDVRNIAQIALTILPRLERE